MKTLVQVSLLVVLFLALHPLPSCSIDCIQNSPKSGNSFVDFFNDCTVDTTEWNVVASSAQQLLDWFFPTTFPVYIVILIFFLPHAFGSNSPDSEHAARGSSIKLHLLLLLLRISFIVSVVPWMWAAIRQDRACKCRENNTQPYLPPFSPWGMPSVESAVSTVVGLHIAQYVNLPLGILFTVFLVPAGIPIGHYSFGQVLVGFVLGLVVHIYSIRTPLLMRIVDMILSLIAGLVVLYYMKNHTEYVDFTFSVMFLEGIVWQFYTLIIIVVVFDVEFIKLILKKSTHAVHIVDFLYYQPVNDYRPLTNAAASSTPNVGVGGAGPWSRHPHEGKWVGFYTIILFVLLCGLKILTPYMNQALSIDMVHINI